MMERQRQTNIESNRSFHDIRLFRLEKLFSVEKIDFFPPRWKNGRWICERATPTRGETKPRDTVRVVHCEDDRSSIAEPNEEFLR